MSLQTAFISMRNISHTCTQLGRLIEQHMFIDACMVFELGIQYVHVIRQKVEEHLLENGEILTETKESVYFDRKMSWIKEMYKQSYSGEISLTTFDMIQCYQFLLEITHYYIHTYEHQSTEIPYETELTSIVQTEYFMNHNHLWKQLSHQKNTNPTGHEQTKRNGTTITYKNSIIYVPNNKASIKLRDLKIKGCNHFLKELERIHIYTLMDLPKQIDFIYLQLSGVGPSSVKKLWNQLCILFSYKVITPHIHVQVNERRMVHLSGEFIEVSKEIACVPIQGKDFPGSMRTIESIRDHGIHTFGQLPSNLLDLKSLPGIGRTRVRHLFNQIRELIPRLEDEQVLLQLSNDERIVYENEQYGEWFLHIEKSEKFSKQEKIPARFIRIARKRYESLLGNKHVTLQELGDSEGITRERVRQILHHGEKVVAQKWKTYIECIDLKLDDEGSILINDQLFSESFSNYIMIQALKTKGIYCHNVHGIRIFMHLDEESFAQRLEKIKEQAHRQFDTTVIDEKLYRTFCIEQTEKDKIPLKLMEEVVSSWIRQMSSGKGILKNTSKAKVVEMIMLDYPDGVAIYKEEEKLNEQANEYMPGKFVRQRDFTAVFSREEVADTLLLWARGVYIHRKFVHAEELWVRDIQHKAHTILLRKKFIHVRKLYESFEKEAIKQHIPNEYALFSLMRLYDEKLLSLERFPMIQLLGEQRIDNAQRVIQYIQQEKGKVTKSQLMDEFVKKRGFKPFTIEQILSDSREIVSYDQHSYTLQISRT